MYTLTPIGMNNSIESLNFSGQNIRHQTKKGQSLIKYPNLALYPGTQVLQFMKDHKLNSEVQARRVMAKKGIEVEAAVADKPQQVSLVRARAPKQSVPSKASARKTVTPPTVSSKVPGEKPPEYILVLQAALGRCNGTFDSAVRIVSDALRTALVSAQRKTPRDGDMNLFLTQMGQLVISAGTSDGQIHADILRRVTFMGLDLIHATPLVATRRKNVDQVRQERVDALMRDFDAAIEQAKH